MKFSRQDIVDYLNITLTKKRFQHTLGVEETALQLADVYGGDKLKVSLAALLHDISKEQSNIWQEEKIFELGYDINKLEKYSLHAYTAPYIYRNIFKFEDLEIDDAVINHPKFKTNASHLCKILYVADGCESRTRKHENAHLTRELIGKVSLDELVLMKIQSNIDFFQETDTSTDYQHLLELKEFYSKKI